MRDRGHLLQRLRLDPDLRALLLGDGQQRLHDTAKSDAHRR
jgi:hypothetical protein